MHASESRSIKPYECLLMGVPSYIYNIKPYIYGNLNTLLHACPAGNYALCAAQIKNDLDERPRWTPRKLMQKLLTCGDSWVRSSTLTNG